MASSNTFAYNPEISELLIEASERCGLNTTELTPAQIASGRRSLNLVLTAIANKGVNLWTVAEFTQYLPASTRQYIAPPRIVDVLADSIVLRQYQMGALVSTTPAFTTVNGSSSVTVSGLSATPSAGQYITVGVTTSVGGLIMDGFYQVVSVPGSGQAAVTASANATSSVTGGAVPQFVTTAGSTTVTVNFNNHGLAVGQPFNVESTTAVGGITLLGPYALLAVASANQFTFTAPYPAGSNATVSENAGKTLLATQATVGSQTVTGNPTDIQLSPLSRGEWMTIPNKFTTGRPTSVWVDRQISPVLSFWPLPDTNGPYELRFKASQQVQDADITGGQTLNVPYRMTEAFVSALAGMLAIKWAPARAKDLLEYAENQWQLAAIEDTERTSLWMTPDISSYFN